MGKAPCCDKHGLKKGPWTPEEDKRLLGYIEQHGPGRWHALPAKAGLQRCGKSCRLRWRNYLRPDIKRGKFSWQEAQTILQLHALVGNRWSSIANLLPKRTDNEIKNYWNTNLKKRLIKMGLDPMTHKPKSNALGSGQSKDIANLNHIAQWESARLEAEVKLLRDSKLQVMTNPYHRPITSAAQPLNKAVVLLPLSKQPMIPPCLDILKARQGVWTNPNAFLNFNVGNHDSPTSSLHFPDSMSTVPSTGFGENSFFRTTDKVENFQPYEVEITKEKANEKMDGMLREVESFPVDVASIADTLRVPGFMEGFTGDLIWDDAEVFNITGLYNNNLGSFSGGNLEDNGNNWNTIL